MLTPKGGIECDLTVSRLAEDRFYIVSAAATELHDYAWIERHLPDDGSVHLENVTAGHGVLTLAGPRSRELLQRVTQDDVSRESCRSSPIARSTWVMCRCGRCDCRTSASWGSSSTIPIEHQATLYELLCDAGADLGLVDFGYRALDSLRLEKAYRLWGADMSADYTPLEAGLERFVKLDKGDFVGREALLRQLDAGGPSIHLSCLTIDTGEADAHAYEPVYADGRLVTYVMAGGYGHAVGKSIALAYLPTEQSAVGTELEVEILGERRLARVVPQPLYDPEGKRLTA